MNLLLTNDDGIDFPGLIELRQELASLGKTFVFAPKTEKSATSTAITVFDDVYVEKINDTTFMVEGYPADCVNIGLHGGLISEKIDLVISGINKGVNMGYDVLYSGTVGAARHAYVHGYCALSISCGHTSTQANYRPVARQVRHFMENYQDLFKKPVLLNINIPVERPICGIKWTKLGKRIYRDSYRKSHLNDKSMLLNLGGSNLNFVEEEGTDFEAYYAGFISVTPLTLDATDYTQLHEFLAELSTS
ncbi:MAG: 5'/3'-nucleotidase SurE [Leptospiraceae bacterium]|nr:5'/3'-nucleotidase SurE [Leptospiraceae bacterium]MDW8307557.1 5'/3'-nucleotidase SurE [Leptospiraceae bacterium]